MFTSKHYTTNKLLNECKISFYTIKSDFIVIKTYYICRKKTLINLQNKEKKNVDFYKYLDLK
jgi:hypothetical protein